MFMMRWTRLLFWVVLLSALLEYADAMKRTTSFRTGVGDLDKEPRKRVNVQEKGYNGAYWAGGSKELVDDEPDEDDVAQIEEKLAKLTERFDEDEERPAKRRRFVEERPAKQRGLAGPPQVKVNRRSGARSADPPKKRNGYKETSKDSKGYSST